jgi:hypothetical protein
MPDRRRHRGPHPQDRELFAPAHVPALRAAVADLSWLLGRGYAEPSSRKLVGDRWSLQVRQRIAVARCACSDAARDARRARGIAPDALAGRELWIDGFNLLTTVEAAHAGGVLLRGRDRCLRDLASLHSRWHRVDETRGALVAVGERLARARPAAVRWLLDRPVGNSGRLAAVIRSTAAERDWPWDVALVPGADGPLRAAAGVVVATADSAILDACGPWLDLASLVVAGSAPDAWILDLG